jgi:polyphosphate glucokinase
MGAHERTAKHPHGAKAPKTEAPRTEPVPASVLVVDVGGTKLKILARGQTEPRRAPSGPGLTPQRMVEVVHELAGDWRYDAVSVGYPGQVGDHGPRQEPGNLGAGWVGFDFAAAFDRPVRIMNDAAMQALGSSDGGRMLFLGFGTGLGSTLIAENVIVPLELGNIPEPGGRTLGDILGRRGLKQYGKKKWRRAIAWAVPALMAAMLADYVVLGGGNAKEIKVQPPGSRLSNDLTAFRGGVPALAPRRRAHPSQRRHPTAGRPAPGRVAADLNRLRWVPPGGRHPYRHFALKAPPRRV